jgi:NAD+ synthetase
MPSQYSSDGSVSDSETLCNNLGIQLQTLPIEAVFNSYRRWFEQANLYGSVKDYEDLKQLRLSQIAEENLQARIRGNNLMAFSNSTGYLVLSTSNKSEASVGYTTLYGDMSGGLAPISDLYKTEVWALSKYYNELHGKEIIPNAIIYKAPSAELRPDQKDTDSLPPYPVLDKILIDYIEEGKMVQNDPIATRVYDLVDRSEFKRRQAPPTIRVHKIAFGAGRKLPIVKGNWRA